MQSTKNINIVSCHAEGEVGDVIVGGVAPPPGETLWEQSRWLSRDERLRNFVLNEPRGGIFRHVNLLVPPKDPRAAMGFIIMEPVHNPPMSGSNSMCVATVLLDTGIVEMVEPETVFHLEAPGGLVRVRARCIEGKAEQIEIENVASFADKLNATLEVDGLGTLTVDTAYGGDSFVIVDAAACGFDLVADEASDIATTGMSIRRAATEQLGFAHPENPDWNHISFCQFTKPVTTRDGIATAQNTVAIEPGKLDRSPCGTGCSARMAVMHARGELDVSAPFVSTSIIGSRFDCRIVSTTQVADRPAIMPAVAGRAWITGTHQLMLDPTDPWPSGHRLSDTWPVRT